MSNWNDGALHEVHGPGRWNMGGRSSTFGVNALLRPGGGTAARGRNSLGGRRVPVLLPPLVLRAVFSGGAGTSSDLCPNSPTSDFSEGLELIQSASLFPDRQGPAVS